MKRLAKNFTLCAALLVATGSALPHGGAKHAAPPAATERVPQPWGVAGDPRRVDREIEVRMSDEMRFEPASIRIRQGETVRFRPRNAGQVMHEMVIGTPAALDEHAELMARFPDMEHDEPWMAHVAPGERGEIVWTFDRPGTFRFACLIPGHYQAGMVGTVIVEPR